MKFVGDSHEVFFAVVCWDLYIYMDVTKNRGTPKWIVYRENPIKMNDLGVPLFLETPKYIGKNDQKRIFKG